MKLKKNKLNNRLYALGYQLSAIFLGKSREKPMTEKVMPARVSSVSSLMKDMKSMQRKAVKRSKELKGEKW